MVTPWKSRIVLLPLVFVILAPVSCTSTVAYDASGSSAATTPLTVELGKEVTVVSVNGSVVSPGDGDKVTPITLDGSRQNLLGLSVQVKYKSVSDWIGEFVGGLLSEFGFGFENVSHTVSATGLIVVEPITSYSSDYTAYDDYSVTLSGRFDKTTRQLECLMTVKEDSGEEVHVIGQWRDSGKPATGTPWWMAAIGCVGLTAVATLLVWVFGRIRRRNKRK